MHPMFLIHIHICNMLNSDLCPFNLKDFNGVSVWNEGKSLIQEYGIAAPFRKALCLRFSSRFVFITINTAFIKYIFIIHSIPAMA